jgi:hypothetical protein
LTSIVDIGHPTFGGHEKFVFRHGWLKKGIDAIRQDPLIFTHDEALIQLGVGKNMVRSIRHWCLATGLAEETAGVRQAKPLAPTVLADQILGPTGRDPYLEDIGSLWLLHWQLATNLVRGYVWHLVFSTYLETEFTSIGLRKYISSQLDHHSINTTSGTVEREVEVCLRTYVPAKSKQTMAKSKQTTAKSKQTTAKSKQTVITEESLDCPLAELDIIRFLVDDGVYRFNLGPKPSLSPSIFGYALMKFLSRVADNRRTVDISECIYEPDSPGQVFKLDENSIIDYLESLETLTQAKIRLQETAGLTQLYLHESLGTDFDAQALILLRGHYEQE